jgi:AraC family transcriptional regulator, exoenzyme S synthesis regulatory protein ExsA
MINLFQSLKSYPALFKQLTCNELLFTNYDCPQPKGKESFLIEQNLIIYVISGRRIFHKGQQSWELKEGVCVFVKKGTHFSERIFEDAWCVMAFFMPDHFLRHLMTENQGSLRLAGLSQAGIDHVLPLDVNPLSLSIFQSMLTYFTLDTAPPENLLELKFKELVLSLLMNAKNDLLLGYILNLSRHGRPSLAEVMQDNYSFNLTLAEYAKLACISVPTFKREFKKVFKDSPARWVLKKRLNQAADFLSNSILSIAEITMECGFENQTHFSRVFRKEFGQSPSQFRQRIQLHSPSLI